MPAANRYTTTELLEDIRRKGHIPPSQTPFADSDLLEIADGELQTSILRQIKTTRENYYLTYTDFSVTDDGLYTIPARAIGGALALVQLVNGSTLYNIQRSEIGDQFSTVTSPTGFYTFYLVGNQIQILPLAVSGTIRLWYYTRPNTLVTTSSAAQITVITSNVLTFSSIPATITTSTPLDIIKDQPGFEGLLFESTPSNVTSTQITLSSVPDTVAVGDWVALAGQTPVPQIPVEFRPLLTQRTVVKYYEIQGYLDRMKAAQMKLEEMEKDLFSLINPRVAEAPKRIVSDNGLVGGSFRWRNWSAT